jgi:peptidoglycan hydrolase CwlO-like protein
LISRNRPNKVDNAKLQLDIQNIETEPAENKNQKSNNKADIDDINNIIRDLKFDNGSTKEDIAELQTNHNDPKNDIPEAK